MAYIKPILEVKTQPRFHPVSLSLFTDIDILKYLRTRIVKRHEAPLVFGMNISSFGEEKLNNTDPVVTSGKVERGAMAAFQVPAIDNVRMA
jgi:hypothetical protein